MPSTGDWDNRLTARRAVFVAVVLLWTAVGEEHPSGGWRFWYGSEFMGMPSHYFLLAGTIILLSPFVMAAPRRSLAGQLRVSKLWSWVVLGWIALIVALARAVLVEAPNPFADWRNLAVFGLVAAISARWVAATPWRPWVLSDLAIGYSMVAAVHLVAFALGGGTSVFEVRTPTFHGPLLYMAIFASITLILVWSTTISSTPIYYRALVRAGAIASTLLVILAFRRSFWLAWGLGIGVVVYMLLRPRWRNRRRVLGLATTLAVGLVFGFLYLGSENVTERLASFLPSADNEFSATNEDHVNDVLDAFDVIAGEPILGFGIGKTYETSRIVDWKTDSFDVHNAILHVWLKFGLLGAVAYLGFHLQWIRSLWKAARGDHPAAPMLAGAAIYLAVGLVATMVGTWPYGTSQMAVFHGIILAALAVSLPIGRSAKPTPATTARESVTTDLRW